ncbi:TPA: DUF3306 domain-containing protein [Vibrio vulnificus]|uniref:DUF3306 domain-containing protein n=1 Tax=Vibrio vulnificus TaxID=672 RepID=UPI001CDCECDE|nr:DUF3306 domain-containing protein [Vibrio vulnificus]MCA3983793.1 DUF3306 domain-containing protein [Vibrio vulnificus]HDY7996378.1 DUF3306 domain-containing protein [Vibrio vulnificus]
MATDFFSRWSSRKLAGEMQKQLKQSDEDIAAHSSLTAEQKNAVEEDHALLSNQTSGEKERADELTEQEPTISALLASEATQEVKKAALRKLFHSEEFNVVDRLNDYDHDYKSSIGALAPNVAQTLREWMKPVEEALTEAEPDSAPGSVAVDNDDSIEAISDTLTQSETQALTLSQSDLPANETRDETKDPT